MPSVAKPRRIVRQKSKGPVDPAPGQRVRALRVTRGLTQAELAGSDFTKGFVSLVETGRTRMSLRAAEILAARLSVSVSELLESTGRDSTKESESLLLRAEAELRAGRFKETLELVKALEARAKGVLKARAQRLQARALIEQHRPREGVRLLDEALRTLRGAGEHELVVRTLFDLARAHGYLEERGEALNLALECERALLSGEVVDRSLELQVLTFIAATYVALGDYGSADLKTERAKAIAEDVADPRAVAMLYNSLAVTRHEQGDYDAALAYSRRALAAYEQLGQQSMIGSTWNTIGWVYIQRQQYARAEEALARAERIADTTADARLRGYVLQTRAELELARGRADRALKLADESIRVPDGSERGRAMTLLVRAQAIARGRTSLPAVNAAFNAAFKALEPYGRRQLARAHELHFEALTARGRFREAAVAAKKALQLTKPSLA